MPVLNLSDSQTLALGSSAVKAAYLGSELKHFNPKAINGLAVWLDAADESTVTLNGANVSEWSDKSGNAKHFAQSTALAQPEYVASAQNGRFAIRQTGNVYLRRESGGGVLAESLSYLGETAHSVFIAWKPISLSGANYLLWAHNPSSSSTQRLQVTGPIVAGSGGQYVIDSGSVANGRLITSESNETVTSAHIVSFRRDGSDFGSWGNGLSIGTATRASAPSVNYSGTFGLFTGVAADGSGTFYANGDLYEVVIYSRAVNDAERKSVERYLGSKWGITVV